MIKHAQWQARYEGMYPDGKPGELDRQIIQVHAIDAAAGDQPPQELAILKGYLIGEDHEPDRWIPTVDAFLARWHTEPRAAAYMSRATLQNLRGRGFDARLVFEDARRVVAVKP